MRAAEGPIHPGEVLAAMLREHGDPTQSAIADRLGISRPRLNELLKGKRAITPDTALRLARLLGTSAEFWLAAQAAWDLAEERESAETAEELERIRPLAGAAGRAAAGSAGGGGSGTELRYLREFLAQQGLLGAAERFAEFRSEVDRLGGRGGGAGDG